MNLLFTSIIKQSGGNWLFTWDDTDATFYRAVLFGTVLRTNITDNFYLYKLSVPSEYTKYPPPLEVVEESNQAESEMHRPYIILQWYNANQTNIQVSYYQIEQWSEELQIWQKGTHVPETGAWIYTQVSPILSDGVTYKFRVLAIGSNQQPGCALPFQVLMVCNPRLVEPDIAIAFDSGSTSLVTSSVE